MCPGVRLVVVFFLLLGSVPHGTPGSIGAVAAPQGTPGAAPQGAECPNVPIVQNFKADEYLGRWYEIERFRAPFQDEECVTAEYSLLSNCSIGVRNTQTLTNGTQDSVLGTAASAGDPNKASLTVRFPGRSSPPWTGTEEGNYNVLATDYSNYAVVYSCAVVPINGRDTKFEFSWVLARRPRVNTIFLTRLHDWLKRLGIDSDSYRLTRQANCQYAS